MLVFGMGLYELFISNLDIAQSSSEEMPTNKSNLFGLFVLKVIILHLSDRTSCTVFDMTNIVLQFSLLTCFRKGQNGWK